MLKTTVGDRPQQKIIMEMRSTGVLTVFLFLAVFGCTPEREVGAIPAQEQSVVTPADREKVRLIVNELQGIEGLSRKTFDRIGQEIKALARGEKISLDPVALVEKSENELLAAGVAMAAKSLSDAFPRGSD